MDALWGLEDRWKLSTQKAIALFACTSLLLIGVCIAAVGLRRRRMESVHQEPPPGVVEALVGSVRWSRREERQREAPTPLLVRREVGWQSHNSTSAVWQRPILMGEKCELPRFSGLILYDHKGMPLNHCEQGTMHKLQEMSTPVVRTTLKELL